MSTCNRVAGGERDPLSALRVRYCELGLALWYIFELQPMNLNTFIRTADPRKVRIVERVRFENERPIVTVAKHRTVTLLPTSVIRSSRELSASVEREFVGACKCSDGGVRALPLMRAAVTATLDSCDCHFLRDLGPSTGLLVYLILLLHLKCKICGSEVDVACQVKSSAVSGSVFVLLAHLRRGSYLVLLPKISGGFLGSISAEEAYRVGGMVAARTIIVSLCVRRNAFYVLSYEVRMRAEYNILEKRKWRSLAEEKDCLLGAKDKEIEELRSQLLKAKEESVGVTSLESTIAEKDRDIERETSSRIYGLEMYEGSLKRLEEFQDNLMRPLETRCLTDLEAYIPSAEVDFNSAVHELRDLDFSLLQELSNKKDASTWDIMDLFRLDDVVAEALGMTDLQPDVSQLMVPIHHKQDRVVIGNQALSVALDIYHPLSAEALIEPPVKVRATNVLSTVVIVPPSGPSVSVEDYGEF
ncbi:hypothetical protein Tco_1005297 [Tanacetum coccineum]|uniref:Uncharacterized protein n=1 Tax=Tanacetum coccineum TaxID=301880 RepID=A0ABQ5FFB5_9ASTR